MRCALCKPKMHLEVNVNRAFRPLHEGEPVAPQTQALLHSAQTRKSGRPFDSIARVLLVNPVNDGYVTSESSCLKSVKYG
jgi:hypothetical protein